MAWAATALAEAPRPSRAMFIRPDVVRPGPASVPTDLPEDTIVRRLAGLGTWRGRYPEA